MSDTAPDAYQEQTTATLPDYLARHAPEVMAALGAAAAADLEAVEMGDGNLNLVFIVTNVAGAKDGADEPPRQVVVKQALPYVRCVGESWPMTLERAHFEYRALVALKEACPQFVPTVHFFARPQALLAMQYLAPPCEVLRKGLIRGVRYPTAAADLGAFCARTLFAGSGFRLQPSELRARVEFWSKNVEMCALTEQVIFTEPYIEASNNRWTSPQLDADKAALEGDAALRRAVAQLKHRFVTQADALLHADLHSGSVMGAPAPGQTFVIDPEFAEYGPMGFDTGLLVANLLLNYASQTARDQSPDQTYGDWILEQVVVFWDTFVADFTALWNDPAQHTGYRFERRLLPAPAEQAAAQTAWFADLLAETLGYAGCEMIRRTVGIAHVEDLDGIADPDARAACERHGLEVAKVFVKEPRRFATIRDAVAFARSLKP